MFLHAHKSPLGNPTNMQFSSCKTKYLRVTSIFLILFFFPHNKYFVSREIKQQTDTADQHDETMWHPPQSPGLDSSLWDCVHTDKITQGPLAGRCNVLPLTTHLQLYVSHRLRQEQNYLPKAFFPPIFFFHSAQGKRTEGRVLKGNCAQNTLKDWESASINLFTLKMHVTNFFLYT